MQVSMENLTQLPFWSELTDEEKQVVSKNAYIKNYEKGSDLYTYGDKCLGFISVISGNLRVYILSEDGREITLYRLGAGSSCVLSASCVISQIEFETIMEAEEDSEVMVVAASAFQSITTQNIHVKCFMYQLATERFTQVMWVMQDVLFLRFDQRLAKFFIAEYDRTGIPEIRMTQEEIAKHVNSAREVVARMLRQFSSDGLVSVNRGRIILTDIESLRLLVG